jgi:hypothetical protein
MFSERGVSLNSAELVPEVGDELRAAIRDYRVGSSIVTVYMPHGSRTFQLSRAVTVL